MKFNTCVNIVSTAYKNIANKTVAIATIIVSLCRSENDGHVT